MRIFEKKLLKFVIFSCIFEKKMTFIQNFIRIFEKIIFLALFFSCIFEKFFLVLVFFWSVLGDLFIKFVLVQDTSFFSKIRMSSLIQIHTPLRVVRGFGAIQTIFGKKRYWVAYALA